MKKIHEKKQRIKGHEKNQLTLLVDGSFHLYRSYYAFLSLRNSKEESVGAIYGVINTLHALIIRHKPDFLAVVFDEKGSTFRNLIYSDYKSNRPSMPDDLRQQINPLRMIIKAMGLFSISVNGVEGDDVIGTITQKALENFKTTLKNL